MRSLLTVLGIVFGVCSVIAMLAIGEGASFEAQEQIRRLGSNNVILRSVKPPEEQKSGAERSFMLEYGLTYVDVKRIRETIPGVTVVVPGRIIREYVFHHGQRIDCDITGTVPWYPEMTNHPVAEGRFFTEFETDNNENVCVLEKGAVEALFPIDSPIGKTVRVQSTYYRVVGVMGPRASIATAASATKSQDGGKLQQRGVTTRIYIPLSAARNRFGETLVKRRSGSFEAERVELHEATVKVADSSRVIEVSDIIKEMLANTHNKEDYAVVVPLALLQQAERTTFIFNVVLGAIAAISLLVGGIGIMNIMLASVTERTREIGIRRALGAKQRDIISQFLVETVLLSATGGIIGVAIGLAIPFFITYFADMITIVTPWSPIIAFTISGMVGVIFGIYPAFRAATMDPVEALRHE